MGLWREIFGPGQDEVWSGLAQQIGADFTPGGWLQRGRVDLHRGNVIVTLDTYTVSSGKSSTTYTRMRSPFHNRRGIGLNVYRKSIFTGLGKLMGMQDITIGDALFDEDFVVQGHPELAVKAFLRDAKIKGLIEAQPAIAFKIRADEGWFGSNYPEGINELYFLCLGVVTNIDLLKDLFELFTTAVDQLSGSEFGCDFEVHVTPK